MLICSAYMEKGRGLPNFPIISEFSIFKILVRAISSQTIPVSPLLPVPVFTVGFRCTLHQVTRKVLFDKHRSKRNKIIIITIGITYLPGFLAVTAVPMRLLRLFFLVSLFVVCHAAAMMFPVFSIFVLAPGFVIHTRGIYAINIFTISFILSRSSLSLFPFLISFLLSSLLPFLFIFSRFLFLSLQTTIQGTMDNLSVAKDVNKFFWKPWG